MIKEKERTIKQLQLPANNLTTYQKGVELGRQLMIQPEVERWQMMAEFWAETILYMAPSDGKDNVDMHIERLAQGGEFLTHLWALLSNVGIRKEARVEHGGPRANVAAQDKP